MNNYHLKVYQVKNGKYEGKGTFTIANGFILHILLYSFETKDNDIKSFTLIKKLVMLYIT